MNGLNALDTNEKISDEFDQDSNKAQIRVVIKSSEDEGIVNENLTQDIKQTLTNVEENDDDVNSISDPYENYQISEDQTTVYTDINFDSTPTALEDSSKDNVKDEMDKLSSDYNVQIEMMGSALSQTEISMTSELLGIAVAFVVLIITFGTFIAAGVPIVNALIGLIAGIASIAILTYSFDIPNIALVLAIMLGIALGIDYALFILSRYRQIIKDEPDYIKAIGLAVGTAGSAVIFAGITVIIAVCGLSIVGIDFLSVMGFVSAITVFMAVLSSVTLLPALMSVLHKQIKPKYKKAEFKSDLDTPWSKFIVGKPLAAALIALIILVVTALPLADMRLGIPDDGMQPDDTSSKKAYDIISDKFGEGFNGQIAMLVDVKEKNKSPEALEENIGLLIEDLNERDGVDLASGPAMSESGKYALIGIIPEKGPNAEETNNLVHDLKDMNDDIVEDYDFQTEITSASVINIEMSEKLNDAIPLFAGVIILLAFVLLMIVFRSIIIPLKAVLGFVLSLAATLGFTTLVMQEGFLGGLFGVDTAGPLLAFLPVIVIGLLFGLAMDYEVFLMSRIHEEYSKTRDNEYSIKIGLKESGPVITAAALIMFSVFIAFVFQDDIMIKSIGIALAFGVLFDAFVVRLLLIPALTQIFGRASWYMPAWLNKLLPNFDIEGHALREEMPVSSSPWSYDKYYEKDVPTFRLYTSGAHIIQTDARTEKLYEEIKTETDNQYFLYDALQEYKKSKVNEEDSAEENSKNNIIDLLQQQSMNINHLNQLIDKAMKENKD